MASDALNLEELSSLLGQAGITASITDIFSLKGGANNRVYRVDLSQAPSLVIKSYFQHPQDLRPRLKAEFEFLTHAWNCGIRSIPQPIYQHIPRNVAIYSYLEGEPATGQHAHGSFVQSAADFLRDLNLNKQAACHVLPASDACLKLEHYIQIVDKRIALLLQAPQITEEEQKLHLFLQEQLLPYWQALKYRPYCSSLEPSEYILTPSDFGLHNVLIDLEGQPYFIDFEYAGWDDPAKTICDFFLQPKIPISFEFFSLFLDFTANLCQDPRIVKDRVHYVFPLCALKWCCIILNVFHPTSHARRLFATGQNSNLFQQQLLLAKSMLTKAISLSHS
ncbi:MAG: aminoglycoside phosphotransferase family protein [Verrucomicrobia bacterium]|nr:aminoglycoside phosphotransferase family protein [Verrucomicrobiota bacterium]MBS0646385.1 aminoglycoside phosphotransferase family protein [Verrucomicrobiota bacterium]